MGVKGNWFMFIRSLGASETNYFALQFYCNSMLRQATRYLFELQEFVQIDEIEEFIRIV